MGDVDELGERMVAWTEWIHAVKKPEARFARMEVTTRRLIAIWVVDGQIQNGGFAQARETVPWMIEDAIAGLRAVGDDAGATLLASAAPDDAAWNARPGADGLDARVLAHARGLAAPPRSARARR